MSRRLMVCTVLTLTMDVTRRRTHGIVRWFTLMVRDLKFLIGRITLLMNRLGTLPVADLLDKVMLMIRRLVLTRNFSWEWFLLTRLMTF